MQLQVDPHEAGWLKADQQRAPVGGKRHAVGHVGGGDAGDLLPSTVARGADQCNPAAVYWLW